RPLREEGPGRGHALARGLQAGGADRARPPAPAGHGRGRPGRGPRWLVPVRAPGPGRHRPGHRPGHPGDAAAGRGRVPSWGFQGGCRLIRTGIAPGRPARGPCALGHGPQYEWRGRGGPAAGHVPGGAGDGLRRHPPAPRWRLPDQAVPGGGVRRIRARAAPALPEGGDPEAGGLAQAFAGSLCPRPGQAGPDEVSWPRPVPPPHTHAVPAERHTGAMRMNDLTKNLLLWVVVAVVLMVVFQSFSPRGAGSVAAGESPSYTRFVQEVDAGRIRSVVFTDESTFSTNVIRYRRTDGTEGQVVGPTDQKLLDQLISKNIDVVREKPQTGPGFWTIFLQFSPI